MLYVPEGFAHGFLTLEDDTEVVYQMSARTTPPSAARGVRWDDPAFGIRVAGAAEGHRRARPRLAAARRTSRVSVADLADA